MGTWTVQTLLQWGLHALLETQPFLQAFDHSGGGFNGAYKGGVANTHA